MSLQATSSDPLNLFPEEDLSKSGERIANMQQRPQITENWCWAASVESVLATCCSQGHRRQREIARDFLSCPASGCEMSKPIKDCDQRIHESRLQPLWRKEGFPQARYEEHSVSFKIIQKEIECQRPVLVDLGHRHVVLVYGWEILAQGERRVYIVDTDLPTGKPHFSFDDLDRYPGTGRWGDWTGTCLGLVHSSGDQEC